MKTPITQNERLRFRAGQAHEALEHLSDLRTIVCGLGHLGHDDNLAELETTLRSELFAYGKSISDPPEET